MTSNIGSRSVSKSAAGTSGLGFHSEVPRKQKKGKNPKTKPEKKNKNIRSEVMWCAKKGWKRMERDGKMKKGNKMKTR